MSEYPAEFDLKGAHVTLRPFTPADLMALQDFAQAMPLHDLLFLDADIQKPEVLVEWAKAVIDGQ
ncbi:MAG TPA: GNAT family N-acetyltransferase, partial [Chakrabartia sp.]|nr:GNAT family N-acetyltransferase [Chakrabartia sp.]